MATVRESKILIKADQNLVDMPILDPGEFAFETTTKKLFIGSHPYEVDPASDGVTDTYYLPVDARLSSVYEVWVNDSLYAPSNYQIVSNTLTIFNPSSISGSKIEVKYNSQIMMHETGMSSPVRTTVTLDGSVTNQSTGLAVSTSLYDVIFIDYSIKSSAGLRVGSVRIVIDGTDYVVDDNYNDTSPVDVDFDGTISNGVFTLTYTNPGSQATFSYVAKAWKS